MSRRCEGGQAACNAWHATSFRTRSPPSRAAMAAPEGEKILAQIGAVGLVRREIGRPRGKFFLARVQAGKAVVDGRRSSAAASLRSASRTTFAENMRVLPMFFSCSCHAGESDACIDGAPSSSVARAGGMAPRQPVEKKLHAGVDTLKNRD